MIDRGHSFLGQVVRGEEFEYMDPVEVTMTRATDCIRIFLHDGSIIAFRLCTAEGMAGGLTGRMNGRTDGWKVH